MSSAVHYVSNHPGTAIMPIGEYLGFTRNRGYGYDPVHRAIRAGLLVNVPAQAPNRACYCLYTAKQIAALKGLDAIRIA
jgi:hypothetical protein